MMPKKPTIRQRSSTDEVERLRQVRRVLEKQFSNDEQFFNWIEKLEKERSGRQPQRMKPTSSKRATPARATTKGRS